MISAGLSLLESINSAAVVPTTPRLNVLLAHPTMTTKGGTHSPPARRRTFNGKPIFEQTLKDEEVEIGGRAKFSAVVKGNPQPLITWFADGTPIRSGTSYRYVKDGERHILMIPRVRKDSNCVITCKAVNQHGETSSSAKLIVGEKYRSVSDDVKMDVTESDLHVEKMDTIDEITSDYRISFNNYEGAELSVATETTNVTATTFNSSIEEKRTELSTMDFENSAVSLLDSSGMLRHNTYSLKKDMTLGQYFPRPGDAGYKSEELSPTKRSPKTVHFNEDSLLLEYPLYGSDSSEVCSESSSTMSFKHVMVHADTDWTEEVRRLIREEIDKRELARPLEESKKVSEETQTVEHDEASPPKFTKPICDCIVAAGETAHFVYILKPSPPTIVTWLRNGVEIEKGGKNSLVGIIDDDDAGCILISDANVNHSGVYTCIAENITGSAKCSAKLIVSPNLTKTSRSTSMQEARWLTVEQKEFRDQTSQTAMATENEAINSESAIDSLREINDDETGEGGAKARPFVR